MPQPDIRILLVEDNEGDARLIITHLTSLLYPRYMVDQAETLADALEALQHSRPDVILLDLGLPDSQGLETLQQMCRVTDVPVVVMTGLSDDELGARSVQAGAQDYLVKGELQSNLLRRSLRYAIQRKRIEIELERARDEALAYSRLKSAFLTKISHELRTPLTGVLGMLSLIEQTELTSEQLEYAGSMRISSELLLRTVNDLLDLSRLEAGAFHLEPAAFDVMTTLEESVEMMAAPAYLKGLELAMYVEPTLPTPLVGDAGRVRQVLANLLSNALKFTDEGEILVLAFQEGQGPEGVRVRFEVHDCGPGIPEGSRAQLFQPFSQVHGTTRGGSGLGLSICRHLIELMGGAIGFDSRRSGGTSFWFTIPLQPTAESGSPTWNPALRGRRVGVLVECRAVEGTLKRQLEGWGIQVETDGAREVDIWLAERPPSGAGRKVLLCPIDQPPDPERLAQEGWCGYLLRPLSPRRLHGYLTDLLAGVAQNGAPASASAVSPAVRTGRILLAEDNVISQRFVRLVLEKMGHEVHAVDNGEDALQAVAGETFDLVLMDCHLPRMDGLAATRGIRRLEGASARVPIVALTAQAMSGDRETCLEAGMDDYVTKPVGVDDLERLCQRWLGGPCRT